ncbi:hypothetical protein [Moorena producens]|uniref:hypothetical protein n=1 Tax=Moorena producens TaxID=1155739 RepID=UPI000AB18E46|nr:hypothetical protein [Moorena producens]
MPIAYCLLPIAYCLLPIAYCLARSAIFIPPLSNATSVPNAPRSSQKTRILTQDRLYV